MGQILHCQLKTHQKKFELDRSRNGRVIENSKNVRLGGWWVLVGYKQLLTKSLLTNLSESDSNSRSEAVTKKCIIKTIVLLIFVHELHFNAEI